MTTALTLSDDIPVVASRPELADGAGPLPSWLDSWLAEHGDKLVALRRHLHANPERSHEEFETARLIASRLSAIGLSPRLLPKGNGVLCDIGDRGRAVALRADVDALPLQDTKTVPYRSTVDGLAHACGHDVHTAILLGAGSALADIAAREELPGRVRLIFQPGEEQRPFGAPDVIAAGGLEGVGAIFALHCAPQLRTGMVGVRSGPLTAAMDHVEVRLSGRGGHTARPHLTTDLLHALGRVLVDTPALLDRRTDTRAGVSMVFGSAHAGEAANTIPVEATAKATVRALSRDAWRTAPELVTQLIHDAVAGTGAQVDVAYTRGVPPVINDRMATAVIAGAAGAALGPDHVTEAEISMGGEDFAFYLEHVAGAMIRLGTGIAGAPAMDIHQATFDVDERAIAHGVRVMVHTALAGLATAAF